MIELSQSRYLIIARFFVIINLGIGNVSACGIAWHELCQLKGPFEGVDERGHVLLIQKLAEFDNWDGGHGRQFEIYAFFRSDSANRSPIAGYGWCVPFFEAKIVQIASDVFCVYQPDGFLRYFARDRNDSSVLFAKRSWSGKIVGSVITVQCSCLNEEDRVRLVFRNGRLVSMTVAEGEFVFAYEGACVSRVQRNGQDFLSTVIDKKKGVITGFEWPGGNRVVFDLAWRPDVKIFKGKVAADGNALSLGRLTLADGTMRTYQYELRGTNEILRLPEKEVVWSAASKLIVRDGRWSYAVTPAKSKWATAAIKRIHDTGAKAFWHDDREKGILTVEGGDGVRRSEFYFTSGKLLGRLRKKEEIRNGKRVVTEEYFYNEKGLFTRMRKDNRDTHYVYTHENVLAAVVENGQVVRTYTPDGYWRAKEFLCGL